MGDRNQEQTRVRIGPQLRLSNLRVGELLSQIRLHALYSTRPHGLVQAIFWHTCPDLDLTHEIHIALSGSMTSRVRVSARSRPFPPLYPHFNRPSGFWPCVKSCLVGGNDKYRFSGFWLGRLAFVPDGWSKPMAYSRPKGPQLRLGHDLCLALSA